MTSAVTEKSVRTVVDVPTPVVRTQIRKQAFVHHAVMVHVVTIAARTADVVIPIVITHGNAKIVKDA